MNKFDKVYLKIITEMVVASEFNDADSNIKNNNNITEGARYAGLHSCS